MLTTKHKLNFVEVSGRTEVKKKPEATVAYNNAKSFIDISDQLSSYSTSDGVSNGTGRWLLSYLLEQE
ncbi:unnamed protein product [Acanthoscelides obtectus]|uniref:Uncharacterized protein n=1 Tax=Acanthoscelides obtectus TaxID=200917 RepID=A0A9P0JRJ2_ACAOB|nr:unnamed protein product [Acanthoscelides obtectus]CAH2011670.1 unnamed protein product [Acanthoscelides obtectus]CAK1633610.1 hypothetical protein AOBTE_LOCUS8254 [Acanthoscelides obtectus]CAK1633864.1 hypothetical protein AOBTE_LOCUS8447 [Acanthoscelides obtectus]